MCLIFCPGGSKILLRWGERFFRKGKFLSEAKHNFQGQKTKTSKLAVISVVLALIYLLSLFFWYINLSGSVFANPKPIRIGFPFIILIIVIGIAALVNIRKNKGKLKGLIFTISAISVVIILMIFYIGVITNRGWSEFGCRIRIGDIRTALKGYAQNNNGKLPDGDKWCDLLVDE